VTIRKQGQTFRLRREVEAMEYVRACTSTPVARVVETNFGKDEHEDGWILMERLPGDQLGVAWPAKALVRRRFTSSNHTSSNSMIFVQMAWHGSDRALEGPHMTTG